MTTLLLQTCSLKRRLDLGFGRPPSFWREGVELRRLDEVPKLLLLCIPDLLLDFPAPCGELLQLVALLANLLVEPGQLAFKFGEKIAGRSRTRPGCRIGSLCADGANNRARSYRTAAISLNLRSTVDLGRRTCP